MYYYNLNQIYRMKAEKNQLRIKCSESISPENQVEKSLYPFYSQIQAQNIKVYFGRKSKYNMEIKADWKKYQLIVFNIIQNAVKYNKYNGTLIVLTSCELIERSPTMDEQFYSFETEIIDTGIGITRERQKMLFIPFLELKMKQSLETVNDHNTGMGLACSKQITKCMQGDIKINDVSSHFTSFVFKIPVLAKPIFSEPDLTSTLLKFKEQNVQNLMNLNKDLVNYLFDTEVTTLNRVEFILPKLEKHEVECQKADLNSSYSYSSVFKSRKTTLFGFGNRNDILHVSQN